MRQLDLHDTSKVEWRVMMIEAPALLKKIQVAECSAALRYQWKRELWVQLGQLVKAEWVPHTENDLVSHMVM